MILEINLNGHDTFHKDEHYFIKIMYLWTHQSYNVESISTMHGVSLYKATASERPVLRREILASSI